MALIRNSLIGTVLLAGALSATAAQAAEEARYGSFGVGIGTGGIGIDFAYPLHRFFDARIGYDFGSVGYTYEEDDDDGAGDPVEYDADLKFSAARLLLDYKPFGGGFRISAGLYTGTPELEGRSKGNRLDEVDIGDGVYNIEGSVQADADLGGTAPYLGIGWGGTAGATGFGMSFDLGVLFADSPSFDVRVNGLFCEASADPNCTPNTAASDPALQADIQREIAELEEDAEDFDLWPILRIGFHYRF